MIRYSPSVLSDINKTICILCLFMNIHVIEYQNSVYIVNSMSTFSVNNDKKKITNFLAKKLSYNYAYTKYNIYCCISTYTTPPPPQRISTHKVYFLTNSITPFVELFLHLYSCSLSSTRL